jgi:DNA polymerase I-like protein with 3'-5' exonuclease and polymerase domains
MDDLAEKFLGNYILGFEHRGRIHAEVHQLRDSDGGTRTFRFSYSNPPLQQIPARGLSKEDKEIVRTLRRVFLAELGERWAACDYSQQEPRLAVHFASLCRIRGADDAVAYYRDRADADFHQMVADMADIPRDPAKIINLGLMYGMGLEKLALSLGLSEEETESLLQRYHSRVPWVRGLSKECTNQASRRGFIRMIGGCRSHFDHWEPARSRGSTPLRRADAEKMWPDATLVRAATKDAFNKLIQGSAARQTKKAMIAIAAENIPILIQMHDELGLSYGDDRVPRRAAEIMRNVVRLQIPVKVDVEVGPSWGDAVEVLT